MGRPTGPNEAVWGNGFQFLEEMQKNRLYNGASMVIISTEDLRRRM